MDIELVLKSGKRKGHTKSLSEGVYLIGRSKHCQIRPKNKKVSRKHCVIIHRGDKIELQDIGSKTGTYINGKRIELKKRIRIAHGDRLQVGHTRFQFKIDDGILTERGRKKRSGRTSKRSKRDQPPSERIDKLNLESDLPVEQTAQREGEQQIVELADDGTQGSIPERQQGVKDRSPSRLAEPSAEDILQLLEDDQEDDFETELDLSSPNEGSSLDLDEASDSGVEFLAPASGEKIDEQEDIPAYQLRQDWDVKGVHKWVSAGTATPSQHKPAAGQPAFQPKKGPKQPAKTGSGFLASADGDVMKIVGVTIGVVVFAAWIAYNIYLLISFKG